VEHAVSLQKSRSMFDVLEQRKDPLINASTIRKWCKYVSQNVYVALFFAIITVWVLFSEDLRFSAMPPSADVAMGWFSVACMVAFTFEILINSFGVRHYLGNFFFWLDVLATASMILDVPAVEQAIFNSLDGDSSTLESAALTRATRTSRMGTRAGRIASVRLPAAHVLCAALPFFQPTGVRCKECPCAGH
jgi:magnesium-transporting ATPase (P-type)